MTPDQIGSVDVAAVVESSRRLDTLAEQHPELRGARGAGNVADWIAVLETDAKGTPMTPPKSAEPSEHLAFRLPQSLLARIDRHAERISREHPGLEVNRTDVVRTLLTRALDDIEAGEKRRKGSK